MNNEMMQETMNMICADRNSFGERLRTGVLPRFLSRERLDSMKDRDPLIRHMAGGLSLGFYVKLPEISDDSSSAMIVVTNKLAGQMDMTPDQIYRRAVKNLLPSCVIMPFKEMLDEIGMPCPGECADKIPILYVSEKSRNHGAAAILCRDVKKKLSQILGDPFIVLPSSVHEVLCLSYTEGNADDLISLSEMVREINDSVVDPADRLSDCAWLCKNGKLIPQHAFFSEPA